MSPSPPTSRLYSPDLPIRPSSTTPLNDSTHNARFLHAPGGSPSARHQSQSSPPQQHAASLSRHRSEPNIRSVAAQPVAPHHPLSDATEMRYQQRQWRQQHRESLHSVTPPSPVNRRPSTAGSAGGEPRGDVRAEASRDVTAVAPTLEHNAATRSRSSDVVGVDRLHSETARFHSPGAAAPALSLVPTARSTTQKDDPEIISSNSKSYAFVALPGSAIKKRPRRRYDEIERPYHCSWSDCTKSYGTLDHLNAHIVMQRHGNKRTPAEFQELRKQRRKAKKDEPERNASRRLERAEERFNMRSVQAALPLPQSYEQQPTPQSYGRQQLYGPGMFGPEMDQQLAAGEAVSRHPLSTETSSMPPQPTQQYGYGAARSLYPVVPTTPIPSWPEQSTQYEVAAPPSAGRS